MATSKLQQYTGQEIRHRFAEYGIAENARPDWLISSKGERLELDFLIVELGIAIEVQGRQHVEFVPHFHVTEFGFQEQQRRDREKLNLCQLMGIDLRYIHKKDDVPHILYLLHERAKAGPGTQSAPSEIFELVFEPAESPPEIVSQGQVSQKALRRCKARIANHIKSLKRESRRDAPRRARVFKIERKLVSAMIDIGLTEAQIVSFMAHV